MKMIAAALFATERAIPSVIHDTQAASRGSQLEPDDRSDYNAITDGIQTEGFMGSITIRNLDDQLKARLRVAAATNGRSMEEEVRVILKTALSTDAPEETSLYDAIRAHVEPIGGIELSLPEREPIRTPEDLLR